MSDAPRPPAPAKKVITNPAMLRTVSAARAKPLKEKEQPNNPKEVAAKLRSGAEDTALNAFSLLRDTWEDFRSSDRFFKYKALIIASWLALSLAGLAVAWPRSEGKARNALKARLISTPVLGELAYAIVNDSNETWEQLRIRVNRRYVGSVDRVPPGEQLLLNDKILVPPPGEDFPRTLTVEEVVLETSNGGTVLSAGP
jgi:hypothetical protein